MVKRFFLDVVTCGGTVAGPTDEGCSTAIERGLDVSPFRGNGGIRPCASARLKGEFSRERSGGPPLRFRSDIEPGDREQHGDPDAADPVVAPPCQFSVANAMTSNHHETFIMDAGHFDYPGAEAQRALLLDKIRQFFRAT